MQNKTFFLAALAFFALSVYMFIQTPSPLSDDYLSENRPINVNELLNIVANENKVMRILYTEEIVTAGKKVGLNFSEYWQEPTIEAGPLPALFLRETSNILKKDPIPLGLFLGSDFPIAASNAFEGIQMAKFAQIRQTSKPEYFYAADIGQYTAMYPDYAISTTCTDCHNQHPDSPKKDWQLHDIMGATTWQYPHQFVTPGELLKAIAAVRGAFRNAYQAYIDKTQTFERPPEIGEKWPRDGYKLPSADVFMQAFESKVSPTTVNAILATTKPETTSMTNNTNEHLLQ